MQSTGDQSDLHSLTVASSMLPETAFAATSLKIKFTAVLLLLRNLGDDFVWNKGLILFLTCVF